MIYSSLMVLLSLVVVCSCTSPKKVVYFQDIGTTKTQPLDSLPEHLVQPQDILQINVNSASQEADQAINNNNNQNSTNNTTGGYLVDKAGMIDLLFIGKVKVSGLTAIRVADTLKTLFSPYLNSPIVSVRFLNYKVSVLGDVGRPGSYVLPNERITLLEAISLAGDLTITARRDNVMVIREKNGERQFTRIDIRKSDLFTSQVYYLQANDIVYVEPSRSRIAQNNTQRIQAITLITAALSLAAVIISRVN